MSMTTQFPCPSCGYVYTKTTGTNRSRSEREIRRKRTCLQCKEGFITYEILASDYALLQSFRKWGKSLKTTMHVVEESAQ